MAEKGFGTHKTQFTAFYNTKCAYFCCVRRLKIKEFWKLLKTIFLILSVILETVSAINRSVLFGLEWHLTIVSTVSAFCVKHFTWSVVSSTKSRASITAKSSAKSSATRSWCRFVILETVSAINRSVLFGLEWHLTIVSTIPTFSREHFSFSIKRHFFYFLV